MKLSDLLNRGKLKIMVSSQRQVYITTIILGVIITASGFWFYSFVAAKVKDQNRISLEAIASLKVRQIKTWFDDELSDLRIISGNLSDQAFHTAEDLRGIETDDYTVGLLTNIANEHNYYEILITGLDGDVIISSSGTNGILSSEELQAGLKAAEDKRSHSSDFFKAGTGKEGKVLCSFICLINNSLGKGVGLVIARVDVAEPLFNAIESWPVPSVSAESYLFKLEGDSVLYLNRLLKRTDTAMWYRKPASTADLTEAMAIKGQPGIYSGKDYDNTRVVAYITAIEGSPWFLSSKIDRAELLKGLGLSGIMAGGLAICLVLLSFTSVSLIYIRRQRNIIEELYENDRNLLLEQAKFKTIMEEIGVGIVVTDLLYRISYLNPFAERVSGWSIGESQGKSFNDVFLIRYEDTDKEILLEEISLSDDRGLLGQKNGNCTLISRMGEKIPVSDLVVRYAGGSGIPDICIITFNDETERRTRNRLLKESERRFRLLFENMNAGVMVTDIEDRILFVNDSLTKIYGYTREELTGKVAYEFLEHPENKLLVKTKTRLRTKGVSDTYEVRGIKKDGKVIWLSIRGAPVLDESGTVTGTIGIITDITPEKLAVEALERSERKYRRFFEQDLTGDYIITTDGKIMDCNPAFARMLGFDTTEELIGADVASFYQMPEERQVFLQLLNEKKKLIDYEIRLIKKDLTSITCIENIVGEFDDNGNLLSYAGYMFDVTEKKIAEQRLHQNEQVLKSILETQQDLICRFRPDTSLTFVNSAFCRLYGLGVSEIIGKRFLDFVPEENRSEEVLKLESLSPESA